METGSFCPCELPARKAEAAVGRKRGRGLAMGLLRTFLQLFQAVLLLYPPARVSPRAEPYRITDVGPLLPPMQFSYCGQERLSGAVHTVPTPYRGSPAVPTAPPA